MYFCWEVHFCMACLLMPRVWGNFSKTGEAFGMDFALPRENLTRENLPRENLTRENLTEERRKKSQSAIPAKIQSKQWL